jgi:hypothetical protein
MAFVTDPDDLDRYQVLFAPDLEVISIRGLGTQREPKRTTGSGTIGQLFEDHINGNFVASGVATGDILAIASGDNIIGHYTVSGSVTATTFAVQPSFTVSDIGLTYRVASATAVDGPQGGNVGEGVTLQSVYSFAKEEWRTLSDADMPDLIKFTFPLESITREQFEIGGLTHSDWDFADDTTRNLIRTGGWQKITESGTRESDYAGIITLGTLDTDAQVYYLQQSAGTPVDFVLTGAVNQAIRTFNAASPAEDFTTFLKIFVRKKARSYAQSEIADIGVTTIETLVNRFPLTHATDAAIVLDDGQLAGDPAAAQVVFQAVETHATGSNGVTTDNGDNTFNFDSSGVSPAFNDGVLQVGDSLNMADGPDIGFFEISAIVDADSITCFKEPTSTFTGGGSSITFTTRTGVRDTGNTNATLTDEGSNIGRLDSTGATFDSDDGLGDRTVVVGDMVAITAGSDDAVGVYKVTEITDADTLKLNIIDADWSGGPYTNQTYIVFRAGMHLQFKSVTATQVVDGTGMDFNNANPDTIVRNDGGNWTTDGYVHGMVVTVTNAANSANNGTFIINTVSTTTLTLIASEALTADTGDTTATVNGEVGFVRTLNAVDYPFSWRLLGNGGTLAQAFQFIQRELRRTTDIDESSGAARGDITDLLMSFASPTGTGINMFIDDLASADSNNATFKDISGDSRNFAFIAGVTITLNTNITNDSNAKVVVFFTDADAVASNGDEFGTVGAIIVEDKDSVPMQDATPLTSPLSFTFDYDNNEQGGRTSGEDADVTIVAIGEETAQYVKVTGTILRQNENVFALVSALERNYSNPA